MRRRRQVLQVSTFPFLAVLLCTMGSLILLLLVIDRQARIVALAKAQQKMDKVAAEELRTAEASRAEWERRRQALHASLMEQDRGILDKVKDVGGRLEATTSELQDELTRYHELQEKEQSEQMQLAQGEKELTAHRETIDQEKRQTEVSRSEMMRITAELRQLENTLADLKAIRKRDQQTFSLVPYRGKRGDNRRPIYIECAYNQVIFHPDRLSVERTTDRAEKILAEVKKRAANIDPKAAAPYLLMLVRPDGIKTYYETLTALNDLDFDFGYEFVDADWILDFPEDAGQATQPWLLTGKPGDTGPAKPLPPPRPRIREASHSVGVPGGNEVVRWWGGGVVTPLVSGSGLGNALTSPGNSSSSTGRAANADSASAGGNNQTGGGYGGAEFPRELHRCRGLATTEQPVG